MKNIFVIFFLLTQHNVRDKVIVSLIFKFD